MNIATIDEALERYVHERMEKGKERARERFLAYVYLKHGCEIRYTLDTHSDLKWTPIPEKVGQSFRF